MPKIKFTKILPLDFIEITNDLSEIEVTLNDSNSSI
jgi:hypothetical protein